LSSWIEIAKDEAKKLSAEYVYKGYVTLHDDFERLPPEQLPHHPKANCLAYRPMGLSGLLSSDRPSNMANTPSSADSERYRNGSG